MRSTHILRSALTFIILCTGAAATLAVPQDSAQLMDGFSGGGEPGVPITVDITKELRQLRKGASEPGPSLSEARPEPATVETAFVDPSPQVTELSRRLVRKTDFHFLDAPLREVADWLSTQIDANVVFDRVAMNDEGIDETEPITFSATEISYKSALRYLLGELNLTYTLDDNLLTITSQEVAEEWLRTRVYPVWDLVWSSASEDPHDADYDTLISCLTQTIAPSSWDDVGGPGHVGVFKGMLTVSQTREVHQQIAGLLTAIRKFPADPEAAKLDAVHVAAESSRTKSAIRAALDLKVHVEFDQTDLVQVAAFFEERSGINHLFDRQSLQDENVDLSDTITSNLEGVTHGKALELILRDLNLAFVADDEAVVIMSKEKSEETLWTKVYSCVALLDGFAPTAQRQIALQQEELIGSIVSNIAPNSWDDVGGPGSIVAFPRRGLLIVDQTDQVHQEVWRHLQMLKRGRSSPHAAPRRMAFDPAQTSVKAYTLSQRVLDRDSGTQIVDLIQGWLVDTENAVNSANSRFFAHFVGDQLLVSHRRDVQEALGSILSKLGAIELEREPGGGGGMF